MAFCPTRHRSWCEVQLVEQAQGAGGQAVAAAFVARKCRFVYDGHLDPSSVKMNCGCDSCWAGADDKHIVSIAQWGDALHEPQTRVAPHGSPM